MSPLEKETLRCSDILKEDHFGGKRSMRFSVVSCPFCFLLGTVCQCSCFTRDKCVVKNVDLGGSENNLYDTVMVDTCHHKFVQTH